MLCIYCSNIDLDQLHSNEGYRHHASCLDLIRSAQTGCESCMLIRNSQWVEKGGFLEETTCDIGQLDTQITARTVGPVQNRLDTIRYGQERRWFANWNIPTTDVPEQRFLWSFLAVHASSDDRSSEYFNLRPFGQPRMWREFSSMWLRECLSSHEFCSHRSSSLMTANPTRLIDVGPPDGSQHPFLRTSDVEILQWVTLSHRWGQRQPLQTTTRTLFAYQQALPLSIMPLLFRDAVVITREMGYRYLWIDSLCIIQDDEADRNREVANMVDIYKNSVFTIAADNCRDSGDRIIGNHLIGDRAREYIQQGCQSTSRGFKSVIYAFNRDQWARSRPSREDDRLGNLDSRAWVLQEQILSPRTLEWTPLELKWTCRATTYSEQCPTERKNPFISATIRTVAAKDYSTKILCLPQQQLTLEWSGSNPELKAQMRHKTLTAPLDIWYHLLLQFLSRSITYETDCLPALSGLAREVKRHTGSEYRAGLWKQDFHNGLLWSIAEPIARPSSYVAPSWSWASARLPAKTLRPSAVGPTANRYIFHEANAELKPMAEILRVDIKYASEDGFGPINSAKLRLSSVSKSLRDFVITLPPAPLRPNETDSFQELYAGEPWSRIIGDGVLMYWLDSERESGESGEASQAVVKCLSESGTIVVRVASLDTNPLTLKRENSGSTLSSEYNHMLRGQHWALILGPADVVDREETWKRLGIARMSDDLVEDEGWEIREFVIV